MFDVNDGSYDQNIIGVREAIPKILSLFEEFDIHATWATVGLLFCKTKKEVELALTEINPTYKNEQFNPIHHVQKIGENEIKDQLHYGTSLIQQIKQVPHQEIGTHTFSHYYCVEEGQTSEQFQQDLLCSKEIHDRYNVPFQSIVFPRNQVNDQYLNICQQVGIQCYRGNPKHSIYTSRKFNKKSYVLRGLIFLDSYINIFGHHIFSLHSSKHTSGIIDIPGSMFLRPYYPSLKLLEKLKYKRIRNSMTLAAKQNKHFHLWWHPHNFGVNIEENIAMLRKILVHYKKLHKKYRFQSYSMLELAQQFNSE